MRKSFFKKIFISLVLIAMLGVISAGCGTTAPQINPPPIATTCTVIVKSESNLVAGQAVYMDGQAQPSTLLLPWGSVQINNVSVGYHVFSIIQGNTFSHNEYLTTVPGIINYVYFYTF